MHFSLLLWSNPTPKVLHNFGIYPHASIVAPSTWTHSIRMYGENTRITGDVVPIPYWRTTLSLGGIVLIKYLTGTVVPHTIL